MTVVIGGGGHARVVIATLQEAGFTVDAVLDDDPAKRNGVACGVPVTGGYGHTEETGRRQGPCGPR